MDPRQEGIGFLLADVSRLMRRAFVKRMTESTLTLAQARALLHVSRREGIRQVELAEILDVQPITLARLIDQLAENALVERRPDPTDRRAYQLFLTPAAAPHLAAIDQVTAEIRADAMHDISKQQADLLLQTLKKMRDNLSID